MYLAGLIPDFGGAIAVGVGNTAALSTDTYLSFEIGKVETTLKYPNNTDGTLTIKGSMPTEMAGIIYELGLFPAMSNPWAGGFLTKLLMSFEPSKERWSIGTSNTTNFRLGEESLELVIGSASTVTTSNAIFSTDLSGYSNNDIFAFGYFINDVRASNMKIRLKVDASNYYEYSFTPSTVNGYHVVYFTKANLTSTGAPTWTTLNSIDVLATAASGGSTVQIDGLSIIDNDYYDEYALVSRGILATPQPKTVGEQLDIEYVLETNV